jgi:transposase
MTIEERLERIECMLAALVERQPVKDWYSVEELARIVGRSEFTCRQWCRQGRVHGLKKESGRGAHTAWAIPHAELLRFQKEGLRRIQNASRG